MQILTVIALILGAMVLLVVALLRVLRDLLERAPFDAPCIDDGLAWPPRTQDLAADGRLAGDSACRVAPSDLQTP